MESKAEKIPTYHRLWHVTDISLFPSFSKFPKWCRAVMRQGLDPYETDDILLD